MKKFCIQSIIIGIGIGMIITASFNFLWDMKNTPSIASKNDIIFNNGLEKSIGELKKDIVSTKKDEINEKNENDGIEEGENVENNTEQLNREASNDVEEGTRMARIVISSGMNTNSIANLLWAEGLISDPDEFIRLAHEREYTRRFMAGRKLIPMDISIDDILEILISR